LHFLFFALFNNTFSGAWFIETNVRLILGVIKGTVLAYFKGGVQCTGGGSLRKWCGGEFLSLREE
jgi:hypothetical protein